MVNKCPFCDLDVIGNKTILESHKIRCPERNVDEKVALLEKNVKAFLLFFTDAGKTARELIYVCPKCFWFGVNFDISQMCLCGGNIEKAVDFVECIGINKDDVPINHC